MATAQPNHQTDASNLGPPGPRRTVIVQKPMLSSYVQNGTDGSARKNVSIATPLIPARTDGLIGGSIPVPAR